MPALAPALYLGSWESYKIEKRKNIRKYAYFDQHKASASVALAFVKIENDYVILTEIIKSSNGNFHCVSLQKIILYENFPFISRNLFLSLADYFCFAFLY